MDSLLCDSPACSEKALVMCEGPHEEKRFCENQYLIHKQGHGNPDSTSLDLVNFEFPREYNSSDSFQDCFLCRFSSNAYIFKLHTIDIPLPDDYKNAIIKMIEVFAAKITRIPQDKSEKIPKKVSSLSRALKQIIYNFKYDFTLLLQDIEDIYNSYHSKLTDCMIKHLNLIVAAAENELGMPKNVKKMFVFQLDLEREKERFIQQFLNINEIGFYSFWKTFLKHFSLFIKEKPKEILKSFEDMFKLFQQEKESIVIEANENIKNFIFPLLNSLTYQRVGLFALKLTESLSLCDSDWILFSSFLLQSEPVNLLTPISLTPSSLLIPMILKAETFLVLYKESVPTKIIGRIDSKSILIASGSVNSSIFIADNHTLVNAEYSIQMGKLKLKKIYDLDLHFSEKITALAYIESQEKLVFVVNHISLQAKKLDSSKIVNIHFKSQEPEILSLSYTNELNFLCLKTQNFLHLFNMHLQLITQINVSGSECLGINLGSNGSFWILENWKLTELRFKFYKETNEKGFKNLFQIKTCKWQMSKDFLCEMTSASKYIPFAQLKFKVPDFHESFLSDMLKPKEFYQPPLIKLTQSELVKKLSAVDNQVVNTDKNLECNEKIEEMLRDKKGSKDSSNNLEGDKDESKKIMSINLDSDGNRKENDLNKKLIEQIDNLDVIVLDRVKSDEIDEGKKSDEMFEELKFSDEYSPNHKLPLSISLENTTEFDLEHHDYELFESSLVAAEKSDKISGERQVHIIEEKIISDSLTGMPSESRHNFHSNRKIDIIEKLKKINQDMVEADPSKHENSEKIKKITSDDSIKERCELNSNQNSKDIKGNDPKIFSATYNEHQNESIMPDDFENLDESSKISQKAIPIISHILEEDSHII